MDVDFAEFKTRAEFTVKKATAISVNATAETIREVDEESKDQLKSDEGGGEAAKPTQQLDEVEVEVEVNANEVHAKRLTNGERMDNDVASGEEVSTASTRRTAEVQRTNSLLVELEEGEDLRKKRNNETDPGQAIIADADKSSLPSDDHTKPRLKEASPLTSNSPDADERDVNGDAKDFAVNRRRRRRRKSSSAKD